MGASVMVFEKLRQMISEQFGIDEEDIVNETSFRDDLNADSLDMVEIVMAIEDEFNIGEVAEEEVSALETVGDVVNFIQGKM